MNDLTEIFIDKCNCLYLNVDDCVKYEIVL